MKTYIPEGYKPALGIYDTQKAIGILKRIFEDKLSEKLHLHRVSAPLFVDGSTGLNDDLNGVERPVSFDIPTANRTGQVVHSLAKWKRMALHNYNFYPGNGLYTDMNAIRRDEELDNTHSVYVDQWDWEKVITRPERNVEYLKDTVKKIVSAVVETSNEINAMFPALTLKLSDEVSFVTAQELEDLWPDKTPKERENLYLSEHKTAFIMQIGKKLRSGQIHDGRAPDYDDWELNGDILFWDELLGMALEVSSMGIRVDEESMARQLHESGHDERRSLPFHSMLLSGELPLTIGGGIGQSRLCMLLLQKAHIGEVQVSLWDEETLRICANSSSITSEYCSSFNSISTMQAAK